MDYYQLRCFISIAKYKSFSKASKELNLTPTSLKKIIRKLEIKIDNILFIQLGNKLILTAFAESILSDVIKLVALVDDIFKRCQNHRDKDKCHKFNHYMDEYFLPYNDNNYQLISERACTLESFGIFDVASLLWQQAAVIAVKESNKRWAYARSEYCNKQKSKKNCLLVKEGFVE